MRVRAGVGSAIAVCLLFGIGSTARALVVTGDADAAGVAIALTGVLPISTGLVPAASVSSPPPGSASQPLFDLSPQPLITSGTATVNASTDVDGLPGSRTAAADSTLGDLQLDLSLSPLVNILTINAGQIFSSASVTGDFGALNATGTSTFGDVFITANNVTFGLDPDYAPNTTVFDQGGILIVANEQILGGDGSSLRTLTVNALRISLSVLGVSGSILLGQSETALSAVPEPDTAMLLGIGLVALARFGRRR